MEVKSIIIIILLLICIGIQMYQTKESFSKSNRSKQSNRSQDNIAKKIKEIAAKTQAKTQATRPRK